MVYLEISRENRHSLYFIRANNLVSDSIGLLALLVYGSIAHEQLDLLRAMARSSCEQFIYSDRG